MKNKYLYLLISLVLFISFFGVGSALAQDKINLKLFFSPHCKACIQLKQEYLPQVISKYQDKISIEYLNITEPHNLKLYAALEKRLGRNLKVPLILVGNEILMGRYEIIEKLEPVIEKYVLGKLPKSERVDLLEEIDLLEKFSTFSYLAIIVAGLVDGINPCAFTVLIFFISFLTLMGYKKRGLLAIGLTFILSVFLTYLAIGLGLFRGFYELGQFYIFLKVLYYMTAAICFVLAYLNLRDFMRYVRTKSTESFSVKLPQSVRSRINSLISMFYRPESKHGLKSRASLVIGTFIVGFLVSLLEAVCTGQVYLPVIVFILKEPALRVKAIAYLLLYNFMFIVPLLAILFVAILGMSSKKLEGFFRNKIALIKILMFILFLALTIFLVSAV